jgi:hypothetical protein
VVFKHLPSKEGKKGISKALPQSVVIGNEWYGDTPSVFHSPMAFVVMKSKGHTIVTNTFTNTIS